MDASVVGMALGYVFLCSSLFSSGLLFPRSRRTCCLEMDQESRGNSPTAQVHEFLQKGMKKKKNRKRKKRETLSWHRKRWSKVTDVEGGQKPQQTTFLFLVILREIQNIFNPPSSCVSVSVCVEYVGGMPTLLDRVRVYNISRYRLRRFVFLFFISLFLIFYLYVWMRSVPARRKGGPPVVCACARGVLVLFFKFI